MMNKGARVLKDWVKSYQRLYQEKERNSWYCERFIEWLKRKWEWINEPGDSTWFVAMM